MSWIGIPRRDRKIREKDTGGVVYRAPEMRTQGLMTEELTFVGTLQTQGMMSIQQGVVRQHKRIWNVVQQYMKEIQEDMKAIPGWSIRKENTNPNIIMNNQEHKIKLIHRKIKGIQWQKGQD